MTHHPVRLFAIGVSFFSATFVSFKFSLWGYGVWVVHVPAHPLVYLALITIVFVLPAGAMLTRMMNAAVRAAVLGNLGMPADEVRTQYWNEAAEVLEQPVAGREWLHTIGVSFAGGGAAGVSFSVIKIAFSIEHALVVAASVVALLLLSGGVSLALAYAYWGEAAARMAEGLRESVDGLDPWSSRDD